MGRYVSSNTDFEFKYAYGSDLCLLGNYVKAGKTDIFPSLTFSDEELEEISFFLSPVDTVPVTMGEDPFGTFKKVFMQIRDYFLKKDVKGFDKNMEEANGEEYETEDILNAEEVQLSATSYYTFTKKDWPSLLSWINLHLTKSKLTLKDFEDEKKSELAYAELEKYGDKHETDLPLLAFLLLQDAIANEEDEYMASDVDEVWITPVVLDGEVVTEDTEIDEYDNYMF